MQKYINSVRPNCENVTKFCRKSKQVGGRRILLKKDFSIKSHRHGNMWRCVKEMRVQKRAELINKPIPGLARMLKGK